MFTGIVEETGSVESLKKGTVTSYIRIKASKVLSDTKLGDSIAVNGVCLTVTDLSGSSFQADVMNETLNRSSLGDLHPGSHVNLERAMAANGRFGGHIVSGHIDGTGRICGIQKDGIAIWYKISAPQEIMRYIVEKGSVAIDGISLTVAKVTEDTFSVSVIPHTASETILGTKKVGDAVNLENDIIGKYIEKLMSPAEEQPAQSGITMDFLAKYGF